MLYIIEGSIYICNIISSFLIGTPGNFVGYYKETGKNCISSMLNGTKYFDKLEDALKVANEHDGGFLRDKDKHYYSSTCVVYGDSTRSPKVDNYNNTSYSEEEREDAINTIVRKSSNFNER